MSTEDRYKGMPVTREEWLTSDVGQASTLSCGKCGQTFDTPHDFYDHIDDGACHEPARRRTVVIEDVASDALDLLPGDSARVVTYCLVQLNAGRNQSDQRMLRETIEDRLRRHGLAHHIPEKAIR